MPLYFFLLQLQQCRGNRGQPVLWSLLFCALLITITRSWRVLGAAFRNRTVIFPLVIAAVLIAVNWLTYVYGVTTGQAVEASLGYFINPLVSVPGCGGAEGALRLQWAAVGIGFIAVGVLTVSYGKLPWIALTLALSFGLYGFVKKRVGPRAGCDHQPHCRDDRAGAGRGRRDGLPGTHRSGHAGRLRPRALLARGVGHHHRRAAAVLRRLGLAAADDHHRPSAVLRPRAAVHRGAGRVPRAHDDDIGFGVVWLALLVLTVDMLLTARKNSVNRKRARAAA